MNRKPKQIAAVGRGSQKVRGTLTDLGIARRHIDTMGRHPAPGELAAEVVAVSRETYDDLVAAAEDRAARSSFAATRDEESLPAALAYRIAIDGENPITVWRAHRGMTLTALAKATSCAKGYLSEIESGAKPGSMAVRRRIAAALGVDLDDLEPVYV